MTSASPARILSLVTMELLLLLLALCNLLSTHAQNPEYIYYRTGWEVVNNNNRTLYYLGTGLTGRYAGIRNNQTGSVRIGLWFVNFTSDAYMLSLVAYKNERENFAPAEVLWTANRNDPVRENASLLFDEGGNLSLRDADKRLVWTTNSTGKGVQYLEITPQGGIILLRDDYTTMEWASWDYPTDTLTILQVLRRGSRLVSWVSDTNSSEGAYSLVMEPAGIALFYNSSDSLPYWVFTTSRVDNLMSATNANSSLAIYAALCWNEGGVTSLDLRSDLSEITTYHEMDLTNCSNIASRRMIFSNTTENLVYATFLRLQPDGNVVLYSWQDTDQTWKEISSIFNNKCDLPNSCGAYGLCNRESEECVDCLSSFNRVDQRASSSGCQPKHGKASCPSTEASFTRLDGIDYFANNYTTPQEIETEEECQRLCLNNCSCSAAFFQPPRSCFPVQEVHTLIQTSAGSNLTCFLKLGKSSSSKVPIIGVAVGSVAVFLLLTLASLLIFCKVKKRRKDRDDEELEIPLAELMVRRFSYKELEEITNGFQEKLGVGGFGSVYKGLLNGAEIAVKMLDNSNHKMKQFYAEVSILSQIHHLHLVRLLGFCAEGSHRAIICEYVVNGSLDKWIFDAAEPLPWQTRFNIAVGVATGMAYLHDGCKEKVIHLDLKPQNILLDESFTPKICDFGVSRLMSRDQSFDVTANMMGTFGYLAPESLDGSFTDKSDVYSFGKVLIEILSGEKSKGKSVYEIAGESSLIDSSLPKDSVNEEEANRMLMTAKLCLQTDPCARPKMGMIVQILQGTLPFPELVVMDNREAMARWAESTYETSSTQETSSTGSSSVYKPLLLASPRD